MDIKVIYKDELYANEESMKGFLVLGLESSCDETAVGVVRRHADGSGEILANIIRSQEALHAPHGGVVPELAARAHISHMDILTQRALDEAGVGFGDLDGIAATAGPGLIGGVMVGLVTGKALALVHNLPFCAINHLEAHALSARLAGPSDQIDYPFLLLLISGGHTSLISVLGLGRYHEWGRTKDDAVGEAFDKAARLLGLGWPGGPQLERAALQGDETHFVLPRPFFGQPHCDFSFSGLKTALRRIIEREDLREDLKEDTKTENMMMDLAASFQCAASDCLVDRTRQAISHHQKLIGQQPKDLAKYLVAAGGVAANQKIRKDLKEMAETLDYQFIAPPLSLCTDNGAMIAWAGAEHLACGQSSALSAAPRARWPLSDISRSDI